MFGAQLSKDKNVKCININLIKYKLNKTHEGISEVRAGAGRRFDRRGERTDPTAIPSVADVTDPVETQKLTELAYRLSRALIGNKLAERFDFPKTPVVGTLFLYRMKQRFQRMLKGGSLVRSGNFTQLLQISVYDDYGVTYEMPDHAKHSKSNPW